MRTRRALVGVALGMLVLVGCTTPTPLGASSGPTTTSFPIEARPTTSVAPSPRPDPVPEAQGVLTTVTSIVDGDTIDTAAGTVRIIGIDTPERDDCGYEAATENLASLIPDGAQVSLVPVETMADIDVYGRLLRYVDTVDGLDVGAAQIGAGLAIARYDSRDGYGAHPRESDYIALDESTSTVGCEPVAPLVADDGAAVRWVCSFSATYDRDWHNDVLCSNGTDEIRPYLREWDSFVTEDEIMESAREYERELNGE